MISPSGALGIGALAIGNVKYGTQSGLFKQMTDSSKPLCLDFRDAFALARTLVETPHSRRENSLAAGSAAGARSAGPKVSRKETHMALINKLLVGKSLVGEGNEVAHIDLLIGPRGSAAELAFANALVNNKDGFTTLLAVVAPNLLTKPNTILFNKVTIKGAKQAVQMFGPAQAGVAKAVANSVAEGIIPVSEADDLFICVGVFIHWDASDDAKIQDYNYTATKEALARAIKGEPKAAEVVAKRNDAKHPFAAH